MSCVPLLLSCSIWLTKYVSASECLLASTKTQALRCCEFYYRSIFPFSVFLSAGDLWCLVVVYGGALWWCSMVVIYGALWWSMVLCGDLWCSVVLYGGDLWCSLVVCGGAPVVTQCGGNCALVLSGSHNTLAYCCKHVAPHKVCYTITSRNNPWAEIVQRC